MNLKTRCGINVFCSGVIKFTKDCVVITVTCACLRCAIYFCSGTFSICQLATICRRSTTNCCVKSKLTACKTISIIARIGNSAAFNSAASATA